MATVTASFCKIEPSAIVAAIGTAVSADDKLNIFPVGVGKCVIVKTVV